MSVEGRYWFGKDRSPQDRLKGHSVGGAMVSPKHAGFIINQGGATAKDVLELSEFIRDQVKARFGVELQYEIQYVE